MERRSGRVVRKGMIYRFTLHETEYAAFIWQAGMQFCGSIVGNTQIPEQRGRTAAAVRDALSSLLSQAAGELPSKPPRVLS